MDKQTTTPARPEFRPKDDSDYLVHVAAATQQRSRRHETLVRQFGYAVAKTGRIAMTNVHPRDLVVVDGDQHWLVEAKTVGINAEHAVREAIGQLFSYRHFYYRDSNEHEPRLLALFDAPIGGALEGLLRSLGIEFLCRFPGRWVGSAAAQSLLSSNDHRI